MISVASALRNSKVYLFQNPVSVSKLIVFKPNLSFRSLVKMSATQTQARASYDLKAVINLALAEDAGLTDGDYVQKGLKFGKVSGNAHKLVVAERVVLNFMQRMSGIATLTKLMADVAYPATILETRKTAPGLRLVDKWAASGNVTIETVHKIGQSGVTFISSGALTPFG